MLKETLEKLVESYNKGFYEIVDPFNKRFFYVLCLQHM